MTRLTLFVALLACVVAACASNSQQRARGTARAAAQMRASPFDTASPNMKSARVVAGCYSISVGAWSDERAPGGNVALPSRIHLDTARDDRHRPGFELVAETLAPKQERGMLRRPAWSPVGTDSLQVQAWANGTSSVNFFLRRRAAGKLEGTARYFWDQIFLDPVTKRWMWEGYPTAPAVLAAVPCN